MRTRRVRVAGVLLASLTTAALAVTGLTPAAAAGPEIAIADTDASPKTNSLFSYLRDQQGEGVLFGHQHTTDNGITFSQANGTDSDVFAGTGEYPAVFGWDTLILEGKESPGTGTLAANGAQNAQVWAEGMINAHELGGINTISAHMYNFATGNDFYDTSGRVVSQILPGGPKNSEFNAYLDLIALTADSTRDAEGELIPIIFRPFHENTGSWFWWGAAHATAGEYKEIFRYTVEYLRDTKGVSNFLYSYSPNGSFGGDPTRYLATYPGDEFVDVLGYDFYENSNEPENSDAWIAQLVPDLGMVADLADERGKIPAFTEFGRNGDRTIKPTGNKSLEFYTDMLAAIKADPRASRITYMQTWSNWGLDQFYVPYPAYGGNAEHEMYPDFRAFYEDPFTVFSAGIADDVYDRDATAIAAQATVRVVSPADGVRITGATATVRVKATTTVPDRVFFTVGDDPAEYELPLDGEYYVGEWAISAADTDAGEATITARAVYGSSTSDAESTVLLGGTPEFPPGVIDDFEGYRSDSSLRAAYAFNNVGSELISLSPDVKGSGENGVAFDYDFTTRDYAGFGKAFLTPQDWSRFTQVDAWLDPDASGQKLVLQFDAGGATFEAYPSLAGDEPTPLAISFKDFRDKANPNAFPTQAQLASVTQFYVYMNKVGDPSSGRIVLDDIKAVAGDAQPTLPLPDPEDPTEPTTPGIVDDFEGYADDAALRAAWTRAGASTLSLSADVKSAGQFGAAFPYLNGFTEFQKAIGADWRGYDALTMWVKPDAERKIVLQFNANGNYYDAVTTVTGTEPVKVSIPFSDFTPSPFQGRDPALRPTSEELANAVSLAVFIEPGENSTGATGTYYLDDIQAEVVDDGEEPSDVVAEDFEGYADDAALRAAWAGRDDEDDLSLSTEVVGTGTRSGAFAYDFSARTYAGIAKNLSADWSGNDRLSAWVKPDGSGHQVVMQFKAGGVSFEGYADLTGTAATTVSIPFADAVPSSYQGLDPLLRPTAEQLEQVTEVAIFLTKQGAGTTGVVYFDDIRATTASTEPEPEPEPVASKTYLAVGNSILFSWQRQRVTVLVTSAGDATPTGTVTIKVGSKTYSAPVDDDGRARFTLPKLRQGIYAVNAQYAGDEGTEPSKAGTKRFIVLF